MKLCYVHVVTEECSQSFLRILKKNIKEVVMEGTEITIRSVKPGLDRASDLHPYFHFLNKFSILERIIDAEQENYDAVIIGCYMDPVVREARATVSIPVIGIAQASMLLACQLGYRFAVVTLNEPGIFPDMLDYIRIQGLESRAISRPIRPIKMSTYEAFTKGIENPILVAQDIQDRARECAKEGAEVVIVGCNGLGPLCTAAGMTQLEPEGIPILDCTAVGLKTAEFICQTCARLRIPAVSRAFHYVLPTTKDLNRVRTIFGLKPKEPYQD